MSIRWLGALSHHIRTSLLNVNGVNCRLNASWCKLHTPCGAPNRHRYWQWNMVGATKGFVAKLAFYDDVMTMPERTTTKCKSISFWIRLDDCVIDFNIDHENSSIFFPLSRLFRLMEAMLWHCYCANDIYYRLEYYTKEYTKQQQQRNMKWKTHSNSWLCGIVTCVCVMWCESQVL